jgi:ABC-type branched-subunit amino acid transport system ATPase component
MPEPILETTKLCRNFGSLTAVHEVDFSVQAGELRAIIGPNGAGKTTFFRLISGEMTPSSGRIRFKGQDVTGMPQHRVSRLGVSKSYQITNVFPHLSVLENVRVAVQSYHHSFNFWSRAADLDGVRTRAEVLLQEVALHDKAALNAAQLSHGEKRTRARDRAGRSPAAAPRRAHRGDEPGGDRRDDTAHPKDRVRPHRHPRRAQDEGRHEHLRSDHRAPPGPGPRRGLARRDPRQHPGTADVSRRVAMTAPLLALKDVHAFYGEAHILQGISLEVGEGEVVALLGRNGAGKTTTLRSIMGIVPPRGGHITLPGGLRGLPTRHRARASPTCPGAAHLPT